jgi:uncharacterized membrane protein
MAHKQTFSIQEAIKFAWKTTVKNFWLLFGIILVTNIVSSIPQLFKVDQQHATMPEYFVYLLIGILIGIINLGLSYGMIKIFLELVDHKKPKFSELYNYFQVKRLWHYFLANALYGLAIFGGFILLVIPGIYFAIKYCFVPYLVIDKNAGIKEAFQTSAKMTQGIMWKLLGLGILQIFIVFAGLLLFFIGLFIALPIVYIADAYIYRKLYTEIKA